jgi:hypothetical protein
MAAAVRALRAAHAAYYELLAPVAVDASVPPPEDASLVLNAALDAGEIPGTTGERAAAAPCRDAYTCTHAIRVCIGLGVKVIKPLAFVAAWMGYICMPLAGAHCTTQNEFACSVLHARIWASGHAAPPHRPALNGMLATIMMQ